MRIGWENKANQSQFGPVGGVLGGSAAFWLARAADSGITSRDVEVPPNGGIEGYMRQDMRKESR